MFYTVTEASLNLGYHVLELSIASLYESERIAYLGPKV